MLLTVAFPGCCHRCYLVYTDPPPPKPCKQHKQNGVANWQEANKCESTIRLDTSGQSLFPMCLHKNVDGISVLLHKSWQS